MRIRSLRVFVVLLVVLAWGSSASAAIAFVGQICAGSTTGNNVTTGSLDITNATLLLIAVSDYQTSTTAVLSDSRSDSYTPLTEYHVVSDVRFRWYYSAVTACSSSCGTTFTGTSTASYISICALAFSGTKATSPADQGNGNSVTATAITIGSITPGEANELVVTGVGFGAIVAYGASGPTSYTYTGVTNTDFVGYIGGLHFGVAVAYWIQTTATATNPVWTANASSTQAGSVESFHPPGSPASANGNFFIFMQ